MLVESLLFFPDRTVPDPPPGVEERWIETSDGVRLHAWHAAASPDAPTLLWSHGNAGNISGRVPVALAFARRGLNVLAYDYRGYGRSSGRPTESGLARDALAVYDHLRGRDVSPGSIVAFGESLGGAVSIRLAAERPCRAVVVLSTFPRIADVARHHYGPLGALAGNAFDSASRLPDVRAPLLIVHGDRDRIVPFALGRRLFDLAGEPKLFVPAPGFDHNDLFAAPGLFDTIATFVRNASMPQ